MSRLRVNAWVFGSSLMIATSVGTIGCGAARSAGGVPGGGTGVPGAAGAEQSLQADVAPVRALVFSEPFLWIGSDRGLRRVRLPAGIAEWVRPQGIVGRRVSALAVDRSGQLLVATEMGVGRLTGSGGAGPMGHQLLATLPAVTHMAAVTAGGAGDGIWAGTETGLFFLDAGRASVIEGTRGVAVTSLDIDADEKSVWVGLRGRGLVRVEAGRITVGVGPSYGDRLDFVDALGTAVLANGTRIAVGRTAHGETRAVVLRLDGPEILMAQPEVAAVALVQRPGAPLLIAGPAATARAYTLALADRGQVIADDGIRFTPTRKSLQSLRLVARAEAVAVPPEVTVGVIAGGDVFVGTRVEGVARLKAATAGVPDYLPVGELALDARGLSVACLEHERCVFATGTGPGWIWDGRQGSVRPIPDGAIGGGLMALAGDGAATVYFVAAAGGKRLAIARLSSDGARWEPLLTLPVQVEGVPIVTFATLSPQGNLWMAVNDRATSGQEFGRGVIEVQLPGGRAIHHRAYRANETPPPEAIPVAGAVGAIRFQKGAGGDPDAIWFCTSAGVMRFFAGQLSQWGENEGLDSESCHDLEIAPDGTAWIATAQGAARFDGKRWLRLGSAGGPTTIVAARTARPAPVGEVARWPVDREGEAVAARALVVSGRAVWAGTPQGVWPLVGAATAPPLNRASGLIDDDVVDLVADRFGRLWVLGHLGLTVRQMPR